MKRPWLDINLEELDRVLEHAREVPLSESDYEKLRNTLHALAGLLLPPRSTEKTKNVLGQPETPEPKSDPEKQPGHGRNGASSYTGAKLVTVPHPTLKPGEPCPGCLKGKIYPQKEPRVLVRLDGASTARRYGVFARPVTLQSMRRGVHGAGTGRRGSGKIRRSHGGHDCFAEVWQWDAVLPPGKAGIFTGHSVTGFDAVGDRRRNRGSHPGGS